MPAHHTTRGWLAEEWHLGVGGMSLLNFCNAYSSLRGNNHCPLPGDVSGSLPGNICQCPAWARLQSLRGTLASSLPGNACQVPAWERLPVCMPCLGMLAVPAWDACQFPAWERFASSLPENICQCPAWACLPVPAWDACQFPAWERHLLGRCP